MTNTADHEPIRALAGSVLQGMLHEFSAKFNQHSQDSTESLPSTGVILLRQSLIREEVAECLLGLAGLVQASQGYLTPEQTRAALIETYDGILDAVYVLIGSCSALGLNFGNGFAEVHRSNMSKTPAPVGTDTNPELKYSGNHNPKGPGYTPPNLESLL